MTSCDVLPDLTGPRPVAPAVVAHRGFSSVAPENTLPAVHAAVTVGADAVEIDVRQTADGEVVVLHDRTLRRTTDVRRVFPRRADHAVETFTLEQVRRLDAGSWFGRTFAGTAVPRLVDVLDALLGTDCGLLVELKQPDAYPGMEMSVARTVSRHPMGDRVTVQSFDSEALHRLSRHAPELRRALLTRRPPHRPQLQAWATAVNPWHGSLSSAYLRRAGLAGLTTYAWTVNDPVDMRRLADMGVDGIITDRPAEALRLLR